MFGILVFFLILLSFLRETFQVLPRMSQAGPHNNGEAATEIGDFDAHLLSQTSVLLSLEIIGRLKGIALMNNHRAPIHSVVFPYECEGTSLSIEEEREAQGACKCLVRPAQKGLINFLVEILKCHSQDRIVKFYRRKEWDIYLV